MLKARTIKEYFQIIAVSVVITLLTIIFAFIGEKIAGTSKKVSDASDGTDYTIIIIDAGHGGEDGGAGTDSGIMEKDINLAISKYLEQYCILSNVNAVMTRNDDRLLYNADESKRKKFFDVRNRVKLAQQYENSFFVSIHQNKFPLEKYHGLQVYYSKNNSSSKELAQKIQLNAKSFIQPDNNREIKAAGSNIYVLNNLEIPAVLVECGFLSNSAEAKNLNNPEYQKKIAFVIFASVLQFVEGQK